MKLKSKTSMTFLLTVIGFSMVFLLINKLSTSSSANVRIRNQENGGHFSDVHLQRFLTTCGVGKKQHGSVLKCVIQHLDMLEKSVKMSLENAMIRQSLNSGLDQSFYKKDPVINQRDKVSNSPESVIKFLLQPPTNVYNFSFIKNPKHTCEEKLNVLFVVPSAPGNFERRLKVRNGTVYAYAEWAQSRSRLLFFTGKPPISENSDKIQSKLEQESLGFEDIVQADFEDNYKNIRLKAVSMLKWAAQFCQNVTFVIRVDDDVTFDLSKLLSALSEKRQRHENFILGVKKENDDPNRNPKSSMGKYYMSYEEYPQKTYPPYLLGGLLGYPIETVKLLYQAALRVKPIWLDDVYITGLCAPKVGVPILSDNDVKFKHKGKWKS